MKTAPRKSPQNQYLQPPAMRFFHDVPQPSQVLPWHDAHNGLQAASEPAMSPGATMPYATPASTHTAWPLPGSPWPRPQRLRLATGTPQPQIPRQSKRPSPWSEVSVPIHAPVPAPNALSEPAKSAIELPPIAMELFDFASIWFPHSTHPLCGHSVESVH